MVSIVVDYNTVQVIVWCIIAVIAYLIQRSISRTNDYLNEISNNINNIQNTLNQIQTALYVTQAISQVQIGKVELKRTSEENLIKKVDGKLDKIIKTLENINVETEGGEEVE